jgi:hypothetical protein
MAADPRQAALSREMENISRRSLTVEGFFTVLTEGSMQDITVAGVQEYRLPSHTSINCNVLCESLIRDRQNIPCASRGPGVISIYLWVHLYKCRAVMGAVCDVVWIRIQSGETSWSNKKYKIYIYRTNRIAFAVNFTIFRLKKDQK